jgi:hypothetical protein
MSIFRRTCTVLLALVFLFPAISAHDDAVRLSALSFDDSANDDSLSVLKQLSKSDDSPNLATLFDWFDALHVDSISSLYIDVSSAPHHWIEPAIGHDGRAAASAGRAPPIA